MLRAGFILSGLLLTAPTRALADPGLFFSEIHYHPPSELGKAEFLEICNTGKAAVDVSGWRLTKGVDFTFPPGCILESGACAVVCEDLEAFRAAFGSDPRPAGVYSGKLANSGELLRLVDAAGNAIQLTSQSAASLRIAVPPGRYAFLRLLVAGGGGDSLLPVVLVYAGGAKQAASIPCDDWYDDNPPQGPLGSVRNGAVPILQDLDRVRAGRFKDRNEPALFEVTINVDASRVLEAIALDAAGARYDKPGRTRFNLFAATAIRIP